MADEITTIDAVDREILRILQDDGRISWQLLGERVHLSANAVAERVRRLTRNGVIRGFRAEINQAALGRTLEAVIDARMPHTQGFDDAVMKRDPLLNRDNQKARLLAGIRNDVLSPEVSKYGLGDVLDDRFARGVAQQVEAAKLPRAPAQAEVFNRSFLPARDQRLVK